MSISFLFPQTAAKSQVPVVGLAENVCHQLTSAGVKRPFGLWVIPGVSKLVNQILSIKHLSWTQPTPQTLKACILMQFGEEIRPSRLPSKGDKIETTKRPIWECLRRPEIPRVARILQCSDTFHSFRSFQKTPYRPEARPWPSRNYHLNGMLVSKSPSSLRLLISLSLSLSPLPTTSPLSNILLQNSYLWQTRRKFLTHSQHCFMKTFFESIPRPRDENSGYNLG